MNTDDHLLETWALALADIGSYAPGGKLAMVISAYEEDGQSVFSLHVDADTGPVLLAGDDGGPVLRPPFPWPAQAQTRLTELTNSTGPFSSVPRLLWLRWNADTAARMAEDGLEIGSINVVDSLTWQGATPHESLEQLLARDPAHRARYRARSLNQQLENAAPVPERERL